MKTMTLGEIAQFLGAELHPEDKKDTPVAGIAPIEHAVAGTVTFLTGQKYESYFDTSEASAIICEPKWKEKECKGALLLHQAPYVAFARLMQEWFKSEPHWPGVSPKADVSDDAKIGEQVDIGAFVSIGKGAKIGERVKIHPGCVIGDKAVIGDDSLLYPNVTVYHGTRIGKRVIIHAGAVIGSDGFGFATDMKLGVHEKIPQIGTVRIDDDVEIGANTTIDRAVLGETRIGAGTKIDNLVQIAHNVEVGRGCFLVSQVGIAGSSKLGNFVTLAGQVGVVGHLKIGDGAQVGAQSGVSKDLPAGGKYLGSPALRGGAMKRIMATYLKGPELRKRIRALEKAVESLKLESADEG